MNNKGSVVIYSFMVGLVIFVLALALAPPVSEFISSARNETTSFGTQGLNCTSDTISNYDKAACVVTDLNLFYFIGGLLFIAGAFVGSKIIFGGEQ